MSDLPIHFLYNNKVDKYIYDITDVDKHWNEFREGRQIWILQTYCLLKQYYPNITLGEIPRKDCINILHAGYIGRSNRITDYYILSIRADFPSLFWSNYEIVQNKLQLRQKTAYITHWPQPGLIKRNNKYLNIKNVAYLGNPEQNILANYPIKDDLKKLGLNYIESGRDRWNDYSDIDLVLAIRSFDNHIYSNKPPSKLINSWWAEVPLIAGMDSAYLHIAVPEEDFISVNSYDELLRKIAHVKQTPDYYQMIIQNGIRKRENYSRENIVNEWINVLENNVIPDFVRWKEMNRLKYYINNVSRKLLRESQRVVSKTKNILVERHNG